MKLKNKISGEIKDIDIRLLGTKPDRFVGSIAELNADWEDYEEQRGNWTIDPMNENYIDDGRYTAPDELERYEELGLKFNTKEEAEKTVEKLKAWKRLKDKGFRFTGFEETDRGCLGDFTIYCYVKPDYTRPYDDVEDDLDICFGGEE